MLPGLRTTIVAEGSMTLLRKSSFLNAYLACSFVEIQKQFEIAFNKFAKWITFWAATYTHDGR